MKHIKRQIDDATERPFRSAVYHDLYARIKMVAKMKSKWPVLARAPRPEAPTTEAQPSLHTLHTRSSKAQK